MAEFDTSIYGQIKGPQVPQTNPMEAMTQAYKLSDLALQSKSLKEEMADKQAVKTAFQGNVDQQTGQVNRAGVLAQLAKTAPMKSLEVGSHFASMDAAKAEAEHKVLQDNVDKMGMTLNILSQAKDQRSWDIAKQTVTQLGMPTNHLLEVYDPKEHQSFVDRAKTMFVSAKDRLDSLEKYSKVDIDQAKAPLERAEIRARTGKELAETAKLESETVKRNPMLGQGDDPAKMVPGNVPKEHQAAVFKEIDSAENTKRMAAEIMKSFDSATTENTVMKTGAGMLRTPASVMALHQALQPTFKDLEGTVRQAAMDNTFKNVTPAPGDSDKTIATKRAALEEYLQSKASAPTARAYGIDLSKFESTSAYKSVAPKKGGESLENTAEAGAPKKGEKQVAPPKVGAIEDGHVFMGGDPSKQSSWKKQAR